MPPKQKAIELVEKYSNYLYNKYTSKRNAIICVDEILKSQDLNYLFSKEEINSMESSSDDLWVYERYIDYWQKVKEEIEKL
jgi:hypothetical protein